MTGSWSLDVSLLKSVNGFAAGHDWFEDVLRLFAIYAQYVFVAMLAVLFLARGKWESRNARHGVIAALLSMGLALAIAHFISGAVDRPRPYVDHPGIHLFLAPSGDPSFPSDHATAAFAIAVSIALRSRRVGWLALAMAIVLCVARVAVGVHYPSDVVAGALLGSAAALLVWIPPVRGRLNELADWLAGVYERLASRVLRRPAWLGST
jgi:undecaprenyl-diphosphatase